MQGILISGCHDLGSPTVQIQASHVWFQCYEVWEPDNLTNIHMYIQSSNNSDCGALYLGIMFSFKNDASLV